MALVNARSRRTLLTAMNYLVRGMDPFSEDFSTETHTTQSDFNDMADQLALGASLLLAVDSFARGTESEREMAARLLAQSVRETETE